MTPEEIDAQFEKLTDQLVLCCKTIEKLELDIRSALGSNIHAEEVILPSGLHDLLKSLHSTQKNLNKRIDELIHLAS